MLVTVAAVGKLKAGPERELFERFIERAEASGRALGLTFTVRELVESRAASPELRKQQEAAALIATLPAGAVIVALDERGRNLTSPEFAQRIGAWRDGGQPSIAFVIGGPDGHGPALANAAALKIAFGGMTWPHQLVRVMLAEQLYRAVTILSGHPYHRA
jgi:23S rRNA (pseudouridine1915-N3)-methyltransferase